MPMPEPTPASNEQFQAALDEIAATAVEIGIRHGLTQHQMVTALLAASISILNPTDSK